MPITFSSGQFALARAIRSASTGTQVALTRLASGLRINSASDDAAGFALASTLKMDSIIARRSVQNVNDVISAASMVESALTELSAISQRQLELATDAASAATTQEQRVAAQQEYEDLSDEWDRIVSTTLYNGSSLLSPTTPQLTMFIEGVSRIETLLSSGIRRLVGTGTFSGSATITIASNAPRDLALADMNGDDILDLLVASTGPQNLYYLRGVGDGTFATPVPISMGAGVNEVSAVDLNNDGNLDVVTSDFFSTSVRLGNGDGTFNAVTQWGWNYTHSHVVDDFNGDGVLDLVEFQASTSSVYAYDGTSARIRFGVGDGTFSAATNFTLGSTGVIDGDTADINGDGRADFIVRGYTSNEYGVYLSNGDGTFRVSQEVTSLGAPGAPELYDINRDGYYDMITPDYTAQAMVVRLGNGDGTFNAATSYATGGNVFRIAITDLNGDGLEDASLVGYDNRTYFMMGNGDGSFSAATSLTTVNLQMSIAAGDLNGDGVAEVLVGGDGTFTIRRLSQSTTYSTGIEHRSIATIETAQATLDALESQQDRLTEAFGVINGLTSRLSSTVRALQGKADQLEIASDKIMDADSAEEIARLTASTIRSEAISLAISASIENFRTMMTTIFSSIGGSSGRS